MIKAIKNKLKKNIKTIDTLIKKLDKLSEDKLFNKYYLNKDNTIENLKILRTQCSDISDKIEDHINDSSLKMVN